MTNFYLNHADCIDILGAIADNSIDSIVTDPPYGLNFMGKKWDQDVPKVDVWRECLRVLKPGGHLLSFGGSRTYHRMACAIEDAGFEIRDQIMWIYGSGMPKSLDVSKAIDKTAGAKREAIGVREDFARRMSLLDRPNTANAGGYVNPQNTGQITAPATEVAKQWQGFGTSLKPSHEPICMARKPIIGTVAENVQHWGTGALNVDACRVTTNDDLNGGAYSNERQVSNSEWVKQGGTIHNSTGLDFVQPTGRWPANLIHDGSEDVLAAFPDAKGQQGALTGHEPSNKTTDIFGKYEIRTPSTPREDTGSAARFFYCAKASKSDRGPGNTHPTVKPTKLMRYLCRLVTPPGGLIFDPYMGSGTTGLAAKQEGFRFIGSERDRTSFEIAKHRIFN